MCAVPPKFHSSRLIHVPLLGREAQRILQCCVKSKAGSQKNWVLVLTLSLAESLQISTSFHLNQVILSKTSILWFTSVNYDTSQFIFQWNPMATARERQSKNASSDGPVGRDFKGQEVSKGLTLAATSPKEPPWLLDCSQALPCLTSSSGLIDLLSLSRLAFKLNFMNGQRRG